MNIYSFFTDKETLEYKASVSIIANDAFWLKSSAFNSFRHNINANNVWNKFVVVIEQMPFKLSEEITALGTDNNIWPAFCSMLSDKHTVVLISDIEEWDKGVIDMLIQTCQQFTKHVLSSL